MDSLLQPLQSLTSSVVPIIVLLGLLIFVHELGHFLVAKYYKVKVEVFSLGFGPKLFTYQGKETQYAFSAIPLGGYVKMYGHDDGAAITESEKSRSFLHKPIGQRIAIVLAGPLMNLFFAGLLFSLIAFVGDPAFQPKVGDVAVGSDAYQVGFRSGDLVTSVDGQPIQRWKELQEALEARPDQTLEVAVVRALTEEPVTLNFQNLRVPADHILAMKKEVGGLPGLSRVSAPALVGVDDPSSPAGQAGLRAGDEIKKLDGLEVTYWRELSRLISQRAGQKVDLEVLRRSDLGDASAPSETLQLTLQVPALDQDYNEWISGDLGKDGHQAAAQEALALDFMASVGLYPSETFVWRVPDGAPASEAGIQAGDRIVSIDDSPIHSFTDILNTVSSYDPDVKEALEFTIVREGERQVLNIVPSLEQADRHRGDYNSRYVVGIHPMQSPVPPPSFVWKTSNPLEGLVFGAQGAWDWTRLTLVSFYKLITNEVSPKNLGGVVSIGQMAQKSWEMGLSTFFRAMAILSINLFIINLLPIPVLDGGQLLFLSIEAIRGAPLSMRKLEIAQQIGFVVLLFLMAYALFNDFSRLFAS